MIDVVEVDEILDTINQLSSDAQGNGMITLTPSLTNARDCISEFPEAFVLRAPS